MTVSHTTFTVRYAETDQMGVVHHSNYPIWFEAGRTDFIREMGLPYSVVEKSGALLPLLELKCVFKSFAKYEDEIVVKTRIKEYTATKIRFHYEVFKKGDEKPIAEGETLHCWVNRDLKPVNIKKYKPEVFKLIEKAVLRQ